MKRKIMALGKTCLAVSLPTKWHTKHSLKKGNELEIEEQEGRLILKTTAPKEPLKTTINLKSYSNKTIEKALSALYKSGFDEITVLLDDLSKVLVVETIVKELFFGFTITDQNKSGCTIKSIAQDDSKELQNLIRRVFLINLSLAENSLAFAKSTDYNNLQNLIPLEKTVNQLTNFCQRIIIKGLQEKKPFFSHVIVWNLEKVADEYKYLCQYLSTKKQALSPGVLAYWKQSNTYLRNYYEFFFSYSLDKCQELETAKSLLRKTSDHLLPKTPKEEIFVVNCLLNVNRITTDFITSTIALNQ
ncbi:hypothetical protein COY95_05110 [Candidatus Woesearchaeota archaeon CG_4_10_14_0_8_um_filter_47_5]|nr:MAG: hypothetical protein COY95_05110 [Candidatus Woesearchaeota archaeon CG_4_10_14_0_8_um_filter_47_5]